MTIERSTMTAVDPTRTVGDLVVERPGRARVFERLGVDYCCGGRRSLRDACERSGLDVGEVTAMLAEADAPYPAEPDWRIAPLAGLCSHIERRHHDFLREELPRLEALAQRVANAHGARHPELHEVRALLASLAGELGRHMSAEEGVLFPACRRLEAGGQSGFPTLAAPISAMEADHEDTGDVLERLRTVTEGFAPPPDACNSYRALLDGLQTLESDLHQHIHKENNILFPRALALEGSS
jgi:regulator of cell morphogenesis and NO signaling